MNEIMWTPAETYEEELVAGQPYEGSICEVQNMGDYLDLCFESKGGGTHHERMYMSNAALPWSQKKMSAYYNAARADMKTPMNFDDASEHTKRLQKHPLKFVLNYKKDKDGNQSRFLNVIMVAPITAELRYVKQPAKDEPEDNDKIPF